MAQCLNRCETGFDLDCLETKCGLRETAHPLLASFLTGCVMQVRLRQAKDLDYVVGTVTCARLLLISGFVRVCTQVCKHYLLQLSCGDAKKAAMCKTTIANSKRSD